MGFASSQAVYHYDQLSCFLENICVVLLVTNFSIINKTLEFLAESVDRDQGPVVQSIVSLTSSLRGQLIK